MRVSRKKVIQWKIYDSIIYKRLITFVFWIDISSKQQTGSCNTIDGLPSNIIWKFHEDIYGEKKTHWQVIYIRNCDDHIWWEKNPFVLMSNWHSLKGPIQTITCISITVDHDKKWYTLAMALLVLPFKFRQQKRGHSIHP